MVSHGFLVPSLYSLADFIVVSCLALF